MAAFLLALLQALPHVLVLGAGKPGVEVILDDLQTTPSHAKCMTGERARKYEKS